MKYAHYDETTKEFLGWFNEPDKEYDTEGNIIFEEEIPIPNIEVSDEDWDNYISLEQQVNTVDAIAGTLAFVDPRTADEIRTEDESLFLYDFESNLLVTIKENSFKNKEDLGIYSSITSTKKLLAQTLLLWVVNSKEQVDTYFENSKTNGTAVGIFENYKSNLADFDSSLVPTDEFLGNAGEDGVSPTFTMDGTTLTITTASE